MDLEVNRIMKRMGSHSERTESITVRLPATLIETVNEIVQLGLAKSPDRVAEEAIREWLNRLAHSVSVDAQLTAFLTEFHNTGEIGAKDRSPGAD